MIVFRTYRMPIAAILLLNNTFRATLVKEERVLIRLHELTLKLFHYKID